MHWKLHKLSPQCENVIWQDELYQLVSSRHVCFVYIIHREFIVCVYATVKNMNHNNKSF